MTGATGSYDKVLGDLAEVFLDVDAYEAALASHGPERLVYRVEEHRFDDGPSSLIVGASCLLPGRVGEEFAVTRGHLHAKADHAELYHCLSGRGVMLTETVGGQTRSRS